VSDQLVDRELEREALDAHLAEARAGRGSIVLLAGEAGVGKTVLAKSALAGSGLEVLESYGAREGSSSYGPVVAVLRALLRSGLAPGPLEPPFGAHLALLLPELGDAAPASDPATLFEAIRSVLAEAASRRPLALFLDDLQWSDDATLDLLPALARSLESEPVLILAAYRSDEVPRGHAIRRLRNELRRGRRLRELVVEPFDAAATGLLLERALGAAVDRSLRDAVVHRTGGVPFFVEELGLALAASERLEKGPQGLALREGADLPLPDSVRDAVLLGASGLSKEAREGVLVAAVAGQIVEPELVTSIAGTGDWPDELLRHGILLEGAGGDLTFRHALVRDALYGEIPLLQRRALHREVAERLEAAGTPAQIVAEHWSEGREPARARQAFLVAATASCGVHAYRDGARSARRALELWPDGHDEAARLDALELLAGCAELAGELGAAVQAWREAAEGRRSVLEPVRLGEACRRLAAVLEVQGRWEEALSSREDAAAAFAVASLPGEAASERLAAATHLRSAGSFGAALQLARIARQEAVAARRVDLEARILGLEGNIRARMGEGRDGLEVVRGALTMALDHNLPGAAAEIYQRLADSLEHSGDYPAAQATYDDAFAFCAASGLEGTAQICLACLTAVLRHTGDWERAVTVCRQVIASPEATAHAQAVAMGILGSITGVRGETSRARPMLLEALSLARRIELTPMELVAGWGLALVDQIQGAQESAAERCRAILERWRRSDDRHYAIPPLRWATTFFAESADDDGARACAAALAEIAAHAGQDEAMSALSHALGETALLDGKAEQAATQFGRAVELLHSVGTPFERLESERRAAAALVSAGRRDEAVEQLVSAYRTARRLGARPTMERLAASLAELGEPVERRLSRLSAEQVASGGLTRRECEVLRLVAVGRTNREIAGELFLSIRTVDMHVRNILRKLDTRSRADAVRRAGELGLLGQRPPQKHGNLADARPSSSP
jgi:ATP/maltotriose-dependent transcriptional regulator MalT